MKTAEIYADAFYSLAKESGKDRKLLLELKYILNIFNQNPQYVKILDSPCIDRGELMGILNEDFMGRIDRYTLNFLKILCQEHMICRMGECTAEYERKYYKDNNIKVISITTAKPLDAAVEKNLIQKLTEKFCCEIVINKFIDPGCIGGIKIRTDDTEIDESIKSKLNDIRRKMA